MPIIEKSGGGPSNAVPLSAKKADGDVPAAPKGWVTVRVLRQGFAPGLDSNGRHYLREVGDVFTIQEKWFSGEWMIRADDGEIPTMPKSPPPTTLPTRPSPVTTF